MKNRSYVAPCVAKKPHKKTAITMTLIVGGIIVALGGIGNGTTDMNISVVLIGLILAGWGTSRANHP